MTVIYTHVCPKCDQATNEPATPDNHYCRIQTTCTACKGEGGPPAVWDEELNTHHVFICGSCAGKGYIWQWME
jgi:DnaJ-class molecular chaperone